MSYILDALKKIEHEKHKKAGPDGRASITGELFHERTQPPVRGLWKTAALVGVAVSLACAGTWFVLRGGGQKTHVIRPEVSANKPVVAAPQPVVTAAPVQAVQAGPAQQAPVVPGPPAEVKAAVNAATVSRSGRTMKQEKQRHVSAAPPKQAAPVVSPPADIKLSGIAWQDERSGRRAVINGFLLKEGAVVSGAKITDILADRVRFALPSGVFELRLDGALPVEVKK